MFLSSPAMAITKVKNQRDHPTTTSHTSVHIYLHTAIRSIVTVYFFKLVMIVMTGDLRFGIKKSDPKLIT